MTEQLEDLLMRLSTDEAFRKRAIEDRNVLAEIGWSPEAIAGIEIEAEKGHWGCGTVCGCWSKCGMGCPGKEGHVAKNGEVFPVGR
jgi:hypothetical protein